MKTPNTLAGSWTNFWLQPVSAAGFGLMRAGFGFVALLTMALEGPNIQRFYGPDGVLPRELIGDVLRSSWRFSLLDGASASMTWVLYAVLLVALFLVMIGLWTRLSLLISVVLLFSFHEYGTITLDGGDTLMRLVGFILLISPCDRAMTLANLRKRMKLVRETGKDQPAKERMMPIWPYRLLLWQMILIYVASSVEKHTGSMWRDGSAVAATLHHTNFSRIPTDVANFLASLSPPVGWFVLLSQAAWILLLLIPILMMLKVIRSGSTNALKRALMLCGILVHGAIFLMMDVGTFSISVFVSYLGLLLDEDFRAIRARCNRFVAQPIIVLFDGRCGLCRRSVTTLKSFDWLHRLTFANFRDTAVKEKHAETISMEALDQEIHIRLHGKYKKGFYGFRALSHHVPPLWILMPILYIPGIPMIGEKIYAVIAKNRPRCDSDHCTL